MADNYIERKMEDLRSGRIDAETQRLLKRQRARIAARKAAKSPTPASDSDSTQQ